MERAYHYLLFAGHRSITTHYSCILLLIHKMQANVCSLWCPTEFSLHKDAVRPPYLEERPITSLWQVIFPLYLFLLHLSKSSNILLSSTLSLFSLLLYNNPLCVSLSLSEQLQKRLHNAHQIKSLCIKQSIDTHTTQTSAFCVHWIDVK